MRAAFLFAVLALVASEGAGSAAGKPQRVMSLNLCTDQLVLSMLPKERIASVSYLSRAAAHAYLSAETLDVPSNGATPEEVLRQRPDLVLAGTASTPALRAILRKVGTPLLEVPAADTFDEIRANVRLVAHAFGEDEKGDTIIAHMDSTLAELARTVPRPRIRVVGWDGSGNVPARNTLFDAIVTAAGGENVADELSRRMAYGQYIAFDLEQLLLLKPDLILYRDTVQRGRDLSSAALEHPLVRRFYEGRQIPYSETLYNCGLPQSALAAQRLREAMLASLSKAERSR